MIIYQCVGIFSKVWAVPPVPPWPNLMGGGTSPEASTENPEASVQRLGGGPIQRHQKIWNDNPGIPWKTIVGSLWNWKLLLLSIFFASYYWSLCFVCTIFVNACHLPWIKVVFQVIFECVKVIFIILKTCLPTFISCICWILISYRRKL